MAEDAAAGSSADAALAESKGTTLVDGGTSIPPGLRVTWSERQDRLSMMLEVVEPEDPCVSLEDSGQVSIEVLSNEARYAVRLQLRSQIDAHRSRWSASGRGWRASPCTWHPPRLPTRMMCRRLHFELRKLRIGRWNNLVAGQQPPNVKVDWSTFIDEEEENELKAFPCAPPPDARDAAAMEASSCPTLAPRGRHGYDIFKMRGAMGKEWGSNLSRTIAARKQAEHIDTSKGTREEEEDAEELTIC